MRTRLKNKNGSPQPCGGAGRTPGEHIADMPHWMGGLPADAPPRRGTPEYDAWMAKRAQDAARPKTEQAAAEIDSPAPRPGAAENERGRQLRWPYCFCSG
jgi:hypothetical protein